MKLNWPERVKIAVENCKTQPNSEMPDYRKIFNDLIIPEIATTWRHFQRWIEKVQDSWAFRGHSDQAWNLETSLDREAILEYESQTPSGFQYSGMERRAASHYKSLLREFQSRAHQYLSHLPGDEEFVDWFAWMQHYGAPTPMLDWTRSPFVALFFAFEKTVARRSSSIWAIDIDWLREQSAKSLGQIETQLSDAEFSVRASSRVNGFWADKTDSNMAPVVVLQVAPKQVNERMAAQQGVFLCNPSFHARFYVALLGMILKDENRDRPCVKKLIVGPRQRFTFLKELRRMNITAASLFPGLEGVSRSLRDGLEIKMVEEKLAREKAIASNSR